MSEYPTKIECNKVRLWKFEKLSDVKDFLEFVRSIWHWPDWGFCLKGKKLKLHTGGWSGNEEIIYEIRQNFHFWVAAWKVERVGGHFEFDLSPFYRRNYWSKKK